MPATDQAKDLATVAAHAAADKLASTIVALDVSGQLPLTDIFVIVSAPTERQVAAIVDEVEEKVRLAGTKVKRTEGAREGRWVLLDFGDIVVHIQHEDERQFYDLERLWRDCPQVDVGVVGADQAAATAARSAVQD
ncbi:ribosome silencing factor [Nostocoides australiense]|uniref:Ribosomal silencing factor RsfS n=1 Tax=Nostocoides australiense Ben110 TaxID=1193182 RepID=W6JVC2_9MICO|nr:ribosome silencing factor [Tetrasphaera australiensis]MCA0291217.1 ribosome silencing factor [Actinomycetota bacterium]MCB1300789.1 ribosome silencing factor [Tetrasphaera sp.]CCH73403.1 ribosomal maturation protein [Tetrasphaera australiensis Ben110]HPF81782.1 ribosome silencing factor [Tetrasphaera australiensis]HRW01751.1 ribosome silencing factor [Tetrasphaera sp.]